MEGIIKFNINKWKKTDPLEQLIYEELEKARNILHQNNLIGYDPIQKVGFGNISKRILKNNFLITGSQTGNLERLDGNHYVIVDNYDFKKSSVNCAGPIKPSSESLSHAAFYHSHPQINAVIHIHSKDLWKKRYHTQPYFTPMDAEYGSVELYYSLIEILKNKNIVLPITIVMRGHEDGIIAGGRSVDEVLKEIIGL